MKLHNIIFFCFGLIQFSVADDFSEIHNQVGNYSIWVLSSVLIIGCVVTVISLCTQCFGGAPKDLPPKVSQDDVEDGVTSDHTYYNTTPIIPNGKPHPTMVAASGDIYALPDKAKANNPKTNAERPSVAPKPPKGGSKKTQSTVVSQNPNPEMPEPDPHTYDSIGHLPGISGGGEGEVVEAGQVQPVLVDAAGQEAGLEDYAAYTPEDESLVQEPIRFGAQDPSQAQVLHNDGVPDLTQLKPVTDPPKTGSGNVAKPRTDNHKQDAKKKNPKKKSSNDPEMKGTKGNKKGSKKLKSASPPPSAVRTPVVPQAAPDEDLQHDYYNLQECQSTIEQAKTSQVQSQSAPGVQSAEKDYYETDLMASSEYATVENVDLGTGVPAATTTGADGNKSKMDKGKEKKDKKKKEKVEKEAKKIGSVKKEKVVDAQKDLDIKNKMKEKDKKSKEKDTRKSDKDKKKEEKQKQKESKVKGKEKESKAKGKEKEAKHKGKEKETKENLVQKESVVSNSQQPEDTAYASIPDVVVVSDISSKQQQQPQQPLCDEDEGEMEDIYDTAVPDDPSLISEPIRFDAAVATGLTRDPAETSNYDYAYSHVPTDGSRVKVISAAEGGKPQHQLSADGSVTAYEEINPRAPNETSDIGFDLMENDLYS